MSEDSIREDARALAGNLASLWNGGREILDDLVAHAGDRRLSPWGAMKRLGPEGLDRVFADPARGKAVRDAFRELTRYLAAPSWFDRASSEDDRLRALMDHPVAYFCAEFGIASWLPIYSGGLGVLAGDMLKEASDMGLPLVAVGLFYRCGFFYQHLDASDYQTELTPDLDPGDLPLERAVDPAGNGVVVGVPMCERTVYARVWKVQVGRVPLYLLDTDTPENERADDREITKSLYGGDQETRIRQELILGVGGVRALHAIGIEPGIYSMNEGHAAFLGLELLEEELRETNFENAMERTRSRVVYTNHTVVPAGNDVFSRDMASHYLSGLSAESGVSLDDFAGLARHGGEDGFSMADLAFHLSGRANAVSQLHAQVIPREWPGYSVEAVTNGVHVPTWVGPEISALFERYVPDWRGDSPQWEEIRSIPNEELLAAHDRQRRVLVDFANHRQDRARLDPDALTLAWARRFAEYKRAWLVASDLPRLARLLGSSERPVQLIIAGKAHPRDETGKRMLQDLLRLLESDPAIAARLAFVEDYDERVARYLTMGADVWLNTPRKPLEASGTSGMKSSDNGCLQLTVTDGWAAEVDWWGVGWGIDGTNDDSDSRQLYSYLEDGVVPTYYCKDENGIASDWAAMMKNSMIVTLTRYSTRRMVRDYVTKLYLPLLGEQRTAAST